MRCEAAVPVFAGPDDHLAGWIEACTRPATAVHRYACVHEHVRDRPTCDDHAPKPGIVGCRRCLEAGHECLMEAQLVTEPAPA